MISESHPRCIWLITKVTSYRDCDGRLGDTKEIVGFVSTKKRAQHEANLLQKKSNGLFNEKSSEQGYSWGTRVDLGVKFFIQDCYSI